MLKIMFLVKRKATLDKDAFSKYWREAHAPIAGRIPGLRKYIQHHVVSGVGGATPPFELSAPDTMNSNPGGTLIRISDVLSIS